MKRLTNLIPNLCLKGTCLSKLKLFLDKAPLRVGEGRLPDWLQKKKGLISLDVFDYNFCVFRCLAVHRETNKQHNLRATKNLAKEFLRCTQFQKLL